MSIRMNDLLKKYGPAEAPDLQTQELEVKQDYSAFSSGRFDRREEVIEEEMTGVFGAAEDAEADVVMRQTERRRWNFNRIRDALSGFFRRTGNLPQYWWADLIFILLTIFGIFRIVTNLDQVIYCIFQLICGFLTIAIIAAIAIGIILILYFALRRRRW